MQAWLPSLRTYGVWSRAARGHLGEEEAVDTTPQKVDRAIEPALSGNLCRPLL